MEEDPRFPYEFDGDRSLDEVVQALEALRDGLPPHNAKVWATLHTADGRILISMVGRIEEVSDRRASDPETERRAGNVVLRIDSTTFFVHRNAFEHAHLTTLDGIDHFGLEISCKESKLVIQES